MAKEKFYSKYTNPQIEAKLDHPVWRLYDAQSNLYREWANREEYDAAKALLDNGEPLTSDLLSAEVGEFQAPAPYVLTVIPDRDGVNVLAGTKGVYLSFGWQTVSGNGAPREERVDVIINFTNNGSTKQYTGTYGIGKKANILIDDYLRNGQNDITIMVTGQTSRATGFVTVTYNLISIGLESIFDVAQSITPSAQGYSNILVDYKAWGGYDKTVEFYVDSVTVPTKTEFVSASRNADADSATMDTTEISVLLTPGLHTMFIRMRVEFNGESFFSKVLGYRFMVTGATIRSVMVAYEFDVMPDTVDSFMFYGEQYKPFNLKWGYYNSDVSKPTATVTWRLYSQTGDSILVGSRTATVVDATNNIAPDPLRFAPDIFGDYTLKALIGNDVIASYPMSIAKNSNGIEKRKNGMLFEVSAIGRSNDESQDTRDTWQSVIGSKVVNVVSPTGFYWQNDAAVFENGRTAEIHEQIFNNNPSRGVTFSITFETYGVDDEDAKVVSIGGGVGEGAINIYGNRAEIISAAGSTVWTKFDSNSKITLLFVVNYNQDYLIGNEPNVMFIQADGVRERSGSYAQSDTFFSTSNVRIGNAAGKCGIRVYSCAAYAAALTADEGYINFLVDSGDRLTELIDRNDVVDPITKEISLDRVEGKMDVLLVDGQIDRFFNNMADETLSVDFERRATDPYLYLKCANMQMKNPGQSTRGFGISQQRAYTDKPTGVIKTEDYDGKALYKGYYAIERGGIPEKKIRFNPQYVDSSMALAAAFFRMTNKTAPLARIGNEYILRNAAQEYVLSGQWAKDMADKFGGEPSKYVWPYSTENTECGILSCPNSTIGVEFWRPDKNHSYQFLSQMTISHEKKSPRSFGQRSIYLKLDAEGNPDPFDIRDGQKGERGWDNQSCLQFEILQNAETMALFRDFSNWSDMRYDANGQPIGEAYAQVFEKEYPDDDDQTPDEISVSWNKFRDFCSWWESCYRVDNGKAGSMAKLQREAANHLDLYKWADYYIKMHKHMMVDNSVRNMELTTDDGIHWYPKWWDTDVQFGIRNDGPLVFSYGIDRQSKDPDDPLSYAFAGHDSWIWNSLEGWSYFMDSLVPAVNQALINAGWTRKSYLALFDSLVAMSPERIYNATQQTKYVDQWFSKGGYFLSYMKGRMKPYIHYMVAQNYQYWDAVWCSGEYASTRIYIRCGGTPNGKKMYFKAAKDFVFGWCLTDTSRTQERNINKKAGETFFYTVSLTGEDSKLGVNDPVILFAPNAYEEIDIHEIARYVSATLDFAHTYDEDLGTNLKVLNVGISKEDMRKTETVETAWDEDGNPTQTQTLPVRNYNTSVAYSGLRTMTRLEVLNVQGMKGLDAARLEDIKYMTSLKEFYGAGANVVSFAPANNITFDAIELPDTVQSITATGIDWRSLKFFNDSITECGCPMGLQRLFFYNVGGSEGVRDLVTAYAANVHNASNKGLYHLTLTNCNLTGLTYQTLLYLAEIPEAQRSNITGMITITDRLDSDKMSRLMRLFGDTIFTGQGRLTISSTYAVFVIGVGGDAYQDEQGHWCLLTGTTAQLSAVRFPIGSSPSMMWAIENGSFSGAISSYKTASLGFNTGVLTAEESGLDDYDIICSASDGVNGGSVNFKIVKRDYPTSVRITRIDDAGNELPVINNDVNFSDRGGGGYILFRALFTYNGKEANDFNGSFLPANGYKWTYSETDRNLSAPCEILSHHRFLGGEEFIFCIRVIQTSEQERYNTLDYWAEFKNNFGKISAHQLRIILFKMVRILGNIPPALGGNPAVYSELRRKGITPSDAEYFTNSDLKSATGEMVIHDDALSHFYANAINQDNTMSPRRNILDYLWYITTLDCNGSKNLEDVADVRNMTALQKVDFEGTFGGIQFGN